MNKKIVYIDLDDVLADFYSAARCPDKGHVREHMMWDHEFFLNLKPIPGSQGALFDIEKMGFDVWILSQPLAEHPQSYVDKAKWVQLYFPHLYKKLILTQNKGLLLGHYLIDDNEKKWKEKFEKNGGKFVHFHYGGYNIKDLVLHANTKKTWRDIVDFFRKEDPNTL